MHEAFQRRTAELQRRLADAKLDTALVTDPDSICCLSGVFGYLGTEFSRPGRFGTRVGDSVVVTETGFEYLTPCPRDLRIL